LFLVLPTHFLISFCVVLLATEMPFESVIAFIDGSVIQLSSDFVIITLFHVNCISPHINAHLLHYTVNSLKVANKIMHSQVLKLKVSLNYLDLLNQIFND
jgi:hypothetical protein